MGGGGGSGRGLIESMREELGRKEEKGTPSGKAWAGIGEPK